MKNKIIISLLFWVFMWFIQSCKRDVAVPVVNNTNGNTNPISVTEQDLIGNWTSCISCLWGGPFLDKKVEFSDSGEVQIFENYTGLGMILFSHGTYNIFGGDTLSMALVYDDTTGYPLCANDTIITSYKIVKYRPNGIYPDTIPYIVFEFNLTINNCNEPLSAGFCPWTNPPRIGYQKKDTCM